jgi:hypothetical protein
MSENKKNTLYVSFNSYIVKVVILQYHWQQ